MLMQLKNITACWCKMRLDIIMLVSEQKDPIAFGLTTFLPRKFSSWVEALFKVINISEAKHLE